MTTCSKCGAQFADGTKFCEACGEKLPEVEVVVNETEKEQPKENKAGKIPARLIKLGAIAVVAVVAVIVLCSLIFSGGGENNFALYKKDGELFYTNVPKFKPFELTSDYENGDDLTPILSKDGTKIFYSDKDDGSLYFRYVNKPKKDAEKIASDVTDYEINEKANLVTYIKGGDLYQHNLKESEKIKSGVVEFWTSENGKKILFVDDGNNLYIKNGNKDAEKIKGEINYVYYVSGDLSTIYYAADGTLFCKEGKKDGQKIDSEVSRILNIYDSGEVLYLKENEGDTKTTQVDVYANVEVTYSLFYFDGKDKKEVTDEFPRYGSYDLALDAPVMVYATVETDDKGDIESTYFLFADGEVSELTTDDISSVVLSDDGKEALIVADVDDKGYGTAYKAKISGKKMKTPEKYDEDVRSATFVGENNDILTRKDYDEESNEFSLYYNKKKVDDDISRVGYNKGDDTLYYLIDVNDKGIGTLKMFNGKKSIKLSDDVYSDCVLMTNDGDVLFLRDYNTDKGRGDLYIVKGNKVKKLDEDVEDLPSYSPDYDYLRASKYDRRVMVSLPELKGELEIA